jgi:hypothetical protein
VGHKTHTCEKWWHEKKAGWSTFILISMGISTHIQAEQCQILQCGCDVDGIVDSIHEKMVVFDVSVMARNDGPVVPCHYQNIGLPNVLEACF